MAGARGRWVWVRTLSALEKTATRAACDRLAVEILTPRWLLESRPAGLAHPIRIFCRQSGSKYSFVARCRSVEPETEGEEFDIPFARLDHDEEAHAELRFHVMWLRHTGRWWPLHVSVTLEEALGLIETSPVLRPFL